MLRCSGLVPFRMIINADPQSNHETLRENTVFLLALLTCFPVRLDWIEGPQGVAAAGDVGVTPELSAGQLQHLLEDDVAPQLAGQGQAGQASVVLDVGIGVLPRVSQSVSVHTQLCSHHHHVQHSVPYQVQYSEDLLRSVMISPYVSCASGSAPLSSSRL